LAKLDAELSCHACQFKLKNVSRTGSAQWKNLTVFLETSRISEFGENKRRLDQIFTFKIKTLPTVTKIPKSTKVHIFV
jgi:hypothetical protein